MADILDTKLNDKLKEKQEKLKRREENDWKKLLSMPEFRRVVIWILGISGYFNDPMTGNSQTFYNVGMQNIARKILSKVFEANPNAFAQMQSELVSEVKSQKEE